MHSGHSLSWDIVMDPSYVGNWLIEIGELDDEGLYLSFEIAVVPGCTLDPSLYKTDELVDFGA